MVFERIQKMICDQFDLDPDMITLDTTFDDVNADSLDIYDLAQSLEVAFDITFREEALDEIKCVADIVKYIESN